MDRGQSSRASNHRRVDQNGDRLTPLTPPEVDVLREIVIGRHTGHIGRRLKIKPKTVDALRHRLMQRPAKSAQGVLRIAEGERPEFKKKQSALRADFANSYMGRPKPGSNRGL